MISISLPLKKIGLALFSLVISLLCLQFAVRFIQKPGTVAGTTHTNKAKLYGWAPEPNKQMRSYDPDTGKLSFYRINSAGWKDVEHQVKKPQGTFRILFVGDSNTYGVVMLDDLYTRKVERMLHQLGYNNVEVISMAVGGWGTDRIYEALMNEGFSYHPDIVVYQFCANDIWEILPPDSEIRTHEIGARKPFKYELRGEELIRLTVQPPKDNQPRFKSPGSLAYKIWNAKRHYWDDWPIDPTSKYFQCNSAGDTATMKSAWRLFEALLMKMNQDCKERRMQFVVFSESGDAGNREWQLMFNRFQTDQYGDYVMWKGQRYPIELGRPLKKLAEICHKQNIELIEPIRKYPRFKNDNHPNEAGNTAMAQDVVEFLLNKDLVR